jgi:hypothetical protein
MIKAKVTLELTKGDPEHWESLEQEIAEISATNGCVISDVTYPEPNVKEVFVTYQDELRQRNNSLEVGRFLFGKGISCKITGWEVIRNRELTKLREILAELAPPVNIKPLIKRVA